MLRYYQSESVDAVFASLRRGENPLVVLPTGSGKSLVIREIVRRVVNEYNRRLIVLQHRKELIEQNSRGVDGAGIYSAGLNRAQINEPVIFAGIQSVHRRALEFGRRQLVVVDECHLVAGEGMFQRFLDDLKRVNPDCLVVGLTATPFRTGEGHLEDSGFWKVCYEAKIPELIAGGFLSPLTNRPSLVEFDTTSLHLRGGEFIESELQLLFDDDTKIEAACQEILAATADRRSVIVFCSGVTHAFHVAEQIGGEVIHGGTLANERQGLIEAFKAGRLKYLCNCDVLTTGFDAPNIDAVAILRATMSPGLFVQMAGRGFRLAEGKKDCLILDFGNNIQRHGPLDAVDFGKKKPKSDSDGEAPEKSCPGCDKKVPAGVRVCECGFIFPKPELKHDTVADSASEVLAKPETLEVKSWSFSRHDKKEIHSLRVDYHCGLTTVSEWVCLNHDGYAKTKAHNWWLDHCDEQIDEVWEAIADLAEAKGMERPDRVDVAILLEGKGLVCRPSKITVRREGKYLRVIGREFGVVEEEEEVPF